MDEEDKIVTLASEDIRDAITIRFLRRHWPIIAAIFFGAAAWGSTSAYMQQYEVRISKNETKLESTQSSLTNIKEGIATMKANQENIKDEMARIRRAIEKLAEENHQAPQGD